MAQNDEQALLARYYQSELAALSEEGRAFSKVYPSMAASLGLDVSRADPFVTHLLEASAFLSARLQKTLDQRFEEWLKTLMCALSPDLMEPYPACTLVRWALSQNQLQSLDGRAVPKSTQMVAHLSQNRSVLFTTSMASEIQAFSVLETECKSDNALGSAWSLRIVLQAFTLRRSGRRLTFFPQAPFPAMCWLYEALSGQKVQGTPQVYARFEPSGPFYPLDSDAWSPVSEPLMAYPPNVHPGRRILAEYHAFPVGAMGFSIVLSEKHANFWNAHDRFELWIPFNRHALPFSWKLSHPCVTLNTVPALNLFEKTSDPFLVNHLQNEHLCTVGSDNLTIHRVLNVFMVRKGQAKVERLTPFFASVHDESPKNGVYWTPRVASGQTFLSFSYESFEDFETPWTVYARASCRNDANWLFELGAGTPFTLPDESGLKATCLLSPLFASAWKPPELYEEVLSQLAPNETTLDTLKKMLRLFRPLRSVYAMDETSMLVGLERTESIGRIGVEAWRGFVPKTKLTLKVRQDHEHRFVLFLFFNALDAFFRLSQPINTLLETTLVDAQTGETLARREDPPWKGA